MEEKKEYCKDRNCALARKDIQHTHPTEEDREKYKINEKKPLRCKLGLHSWEGPYGKLRICKLCKINDSYTKRWGETDLGQSQ